MVTGDPPVVGELHASTGAGQPGALAAEQPVQRRRTTQRIAAAAAAVAILGGGAGALAVHRSRSHPVLALPASPAATATATPSPAAPPAPDPAPSPHIVGNPLAKVDWPNATLPLPPDQGTCSAPPAHFHAGSAKGPHDVSWKLFGAAHGSFTKPIYADLLGDETPEAIVELDCDVVVPVVRSVVVYSAGPGGSPAIAALVTTAHPDMLEWVESVAVKNRIVSVLIHADAEGNGAIPQTTTIRNMVWSVSRFVHADPKLAILDADPRTAAVTLPATGGCAAYTGPLPPPAGGNRSYWTFAAPAEQPRPQIGDLDGDGVAEDLVPEACMATTDGVTYSMTRTVVVALRVSPAGDLATLGTVAVFPFHDGDPVITRLAVAGGKVKVTRADGTSVLYSWTGEKFTRT